MRTGGSGERGAIFFGHGAGGEEDKKNILRYFRQIDKGVHEALKDERASSDLDTIVPAAYHARVDVLFVAVGVQRWGRFDPNTGQVHVRETAEPGDEDLLDFAAIHSILNGGTVYAVAPANVPGAAPVAATFRY